MTRADFKLYLPTKEEEESPSVYVNKKLVPLAQRLYEMANQCVSHGAPEDQSNIDMVPQEITSKFRDINTYLETKRNKTCTFSVDDKQPLHKNGKFLKVLVKMTVRSSNGKPVAFRLVNSKTGNAIKDSLVLCSSKDFNDYLVSVSLGNGDYQVHTGKNDYHIAAKYLNEFSQPVLKRFSMDVVYA